MIESNDSFPAVARVPEKVGLLGSQQPVGGESRASMEVNHMHDSEGGNEETSPMISSF